MRSYIILKHMLDVTCAELASGIDICLIFSNFHWLSELEGTVLKYSSGHIKHTHTLCNIFFLTYTTQLAKYGLEF
jgi:hypothetical protein